MGIITLGSNGFMDKTASMKKDRGQFARDLRTAYDLMQRAGIDVDLAFSQAGAGLIKIARKIGYQKTVHLLSVFNRIAQRNGQYIQNLETDVPERQKLIAQLREIFTDVRARRGVSVSGGVFLPLIALAAVAAAVIAKRGYTPPPAPPPAPKEDPLLTEANRTLLAYMSLYSQWHANQAGVQKPSLKLRSDAIVSAHRLGLPKTAAAIASDGGLPKDEMWPDTKTSVDAYIKRYLAMFAPPPVTRATTKGTDMRADLDLGREEDMEGVYSTGVDSIVGKPRRRRPAGGGITRITMEPLEIRAGRVSPAMRTVDPHTAMVLDQIRSARMPGHRVLL